MKRYNRQMPLSLGSCGCNCACDRARCGEGAANCCESAAEPDVDVVSVKARMGHDQTRRFSLQSSQRDVTSLFSFLRKIFGVTGRILVTYQNSDGGIVPLSSDADLCNAVSCAQKAATPILYLFVTPKNDGIRPKTADMIYTGENLRAVTLPMGGIGTGAVSICGDGGFRQWEIVNEVYHTAQVPHSFFAAKIGTNGVVLQSSQNYDQSDFTPAPLVSDHVVPDSSKTLLSTLPSIPSLSLTAKYPIAELSYDTSALGTALQFSSRIYTPFCPLNIQYSSLPVVICQFNVSNTTTSPVSASLMMTQQNFVGWDGKSQITDVSNSGYGNNINSATTQINGTKWVSMYQTGTQDSAPYVGHVGLCVLSPDASDTVQLIEQWTDLNTIWAEFMGTTTTTTTTTTKTKTSSPQPGQTDPSPSGTTWNAAAIVSFTVAAQSTHTVNFALVWHFPNHWVNYSQPYNIADSKSKLWLGNQYTTFWPSIVEVVNYITTNFSTLDAITQAFVDSFYSSTLNWQ
ncbi:Glucosylceramidase domain protein, partial [Pelomyxa schiedti]